MNTFDYDPLLILAEWTRMEIILESQLRAVRGWKDLETAEEMFKLLTRMAGKAKFAMESVKCQKVEGQRERA